MARSVWRGIWRLADPKISLASMASIFLGAAAAGGDGPLSPGWLAATVLGIFAIEVGKNASGEIFDFASDSAVAPEDRSPFSGGKRVLVDGLLTKRQTAAVGAAGFLGGVGIGLAIALLREPKVLWIGAAGVAAAYFYNAPPVRLSYRGFGELAVGLCYGPLIACGTYLVQRGTVTLPVLWTSVSLGLLIAAFLWVNEFPDFHADRIAGKRTLVVRLGRQRASRLFVLLLGVSLLLLLIGPLFGVPLASWLGMAASIPAAGGAHALLTRPEDTSRIVPAQAQTLLSFLLLSLGSGLGLGLLHTVLTRPGPGT